MNRKTSLSLFRIRLAQNNIFQGILLLLSLILPIISLIQMHFTSPEDKLLFNPYSCLWIGFYSSVLLILFRKKRTLLSVLKVALILVNLLFIAFWLFFSLMGGIQGFSFMLLKMILPFLPSAWLFHHLLLLFPPERFPPV